MEQVTRKELDKRVEQSRAFKKLLQMPEFKETIVAFFDELAQEQEKTHILSVKPENLTNTWWYHAGIASVVDRYKTAVAQWIGDDTLSVDNLEIVDDE